MGEGGAIAPPAVIAAAVEDALRPQVPLTPERVRRFAEEAARAGTGGDV